MLRVLMVLEDYGELMFLQTVLKKIGFDVDSTQNPRMFQDSLLSMNPDVLVMTAVGRRIKGVDLVGSVKRVRGNPKIILIRSNSFSGTPDTSVDAWIDSPVGVVDLLDAIADLCGLNKQNLQDKLLRLRMQDGEPEELRVLKSKDTNEPILERAKTDSGNFGVLAPSTMKPEERQQRYKKFLNESPPDKHGYSVKEVQEHVKNLRHQETNSDLADLEKERRAFVEHLFKKKAG